MVAIIHCSSCEPNTIERSDRNPVAIDGPVAISAARYRSSSSNSTTTPQKALAKSDVVMRLVAHFRAIVLAHIISFVAPTGGSYFIHLLFIFYFIWTHGNHLIAPMLRQWATQKRYLWHLIWTQRATKFRRPLISIGHKCECINCPETEKLRPKWCSNLPFAKLFSTPFRSWTLLFISLNLFEANNLHSANPNEKKTDKIPGTWRARAHDELNSR